MARVPQRLSKTRSVAQRAKGSESPQLTEHQLKQRRHILNHAAKLFAETGYSAATMDNLSDVTGLNKASLYYYFASKQDILFDLCCEGISAGTRLTLPAMQMTSARAALIHIIEVGIHNLYDYLFEVRIFQQEFPYFKQIFSPEQYEKLQALQKEYMDIFMTVLEQGMRDKEFRELDIKVTSNFLIASLFGNSSRYAHIDISPQDLTRELAALLLGGLERRD